MTFEQEFDSRVNAFLSQSGLSPASLVVDNPMGILVAGVGAGRAPVTESGR